MAASLSGWQEAALVGLASGMTPEQVRQELLEPPEEVPEPSKKQHSHAASPRESDVELLESLRSPAAAMEFATIEGVDELRESSRMETSAPGGCSCTRRSAASSTVGGTDRSVWAEELEPERPSSSFTGRCLWHGRIREPGSSSRRSQRTSPMSCPRVWSRSTPPCRGRPRWDSQACTSSVLMPWPTLLSGGPEPTSPRQPKASWEPHAPMCPGAPPSGFGAMSSITPDRRYPSG